MGDLLCFGRTAAGGNPVTTTERFHDVLPGGRCDDIRVELPFDPDEVVGNLRYERYLNRDQGLTEHSRMARRMYYSARPFLPRAVRTLVQKAYVRGWQNIGFPQWPVDTTVDRLLKKLMELCVRHRGKSIPFIWFWPEGKSACALLSHDVETRRGAERCRWLMDMDDASGVPASFHVIPEGRYPVTSKFLSEFRQRGFEINVHDLNHDGRLFQTQAEFRGRAARINRYAEEFGARGFRSGSLYRNQDWYDCLNFEYDSSVPNVAHLEPQRGGCCTVMPYFVGNVLELPLTMTQDYCALHLIKGDTADLWRRQSEIILRYNGLLNVIVHPDYSWESRGRAAYRALLTLYQRLRDQENVWLAQPGQVNDWWRQRARMKLVSTRAGWKVEGSGSERARVAFATLDGDSLSYHFSPSTKTLQKAV